MAVPIEDQPYGPDVSHHKGVINWQRVKEEGGASFALIKCSQGTGFRDPKFAKNMLDAESVGLITGAYHYLSYEHPPREQAHWYVRQVGGTFPKGMLPPIIDCENDTDDPETNKQYSRAFMLRYIREFIDELHTITGRWPIIYTYPYFWRDVLGNPSDFWRNCPLWMADYSHKKPVLAGGWPFHTFHQFTSTGTIAGVPGHATDLNRFNGTLARLRVLAGMP